MAAAIISGRIIGSSPCTMTMMSAASFALTSATRSVARS
jgi:hypothetical protein